VRCFLTLALNVFVLFLMECRMNKNPLGSNPFEVLCIAMFLLFVVYYLKTFFRSIHLLVNAVFGPVKRYWFDFAIGSLIVIANVAGAPLFSGVFTLIPMFVKALQGGPKGTYVLFADCVLLHSALICTGAWCIVFLVVAANIMANSCTRKKHMELPAGQLLIAVTTVVYSLNSMFLFLLAQNVITNLLPAYIYAYANNQSAIQDLKVHRDSADLIINYFSWYFLCVALVSNYAVSFYGGLSMVRDERERKYQAAQSAARWANLGNCPRKH
jgi:hypothetical protein